jgi:transcriptional regulator with XRE-family HTH domain
MDELISTVRARRLMKEMRQIRIAAGLTVARAGAQAGVSEATLWRMENGKTKVSPEALMALLDLYGVRSPRRDVLERLALDALRRGWWTPFKDVFSGSYVALESDASQIRVNAFNVPGFFQTADYVRAIIATTRPELQPAEVERRTEARLARQRALFADREVPPVVHVLLDESAVRRQVGGPQVMRGQLDRLAGEAALPNVTIQVVPFGAGSHAATDGEFVIIDYPDPEDDPFVYEEGLFGDIYVETPEDVARYRLAFDRVAADAALAPADSLELITRIAEENQSR